MCKSEGPLQLHRLTARGRSPLQRSDHGKYRSAAAMLRGIGRPAFTQVANAPPRPQWNGATVHRRHPVAHRVASPAGKLCPRHPRERRPAPVS